MNNMDEEKVSLPKAVVALLMIIGGILGIIYVNFVSNLIEKYFL